jgi:hypothetical protein
MNSPCSKLRGIKSAQFHFADSNEKFGFDISQLLATGDS